jgi:hypothetical protein
MKIVALLAVVWAGLMAVAAFAAVKGDTSLLIVAVVCGVPVAFLISVMMQQYGRRRNDDGTTSHDVGSTNGRRRDAAP